VLDPLLWKPAGYLSMISAGEGASFLVYFNTPLNSGDVVRLLGPEKIPDIITEEKNIKDLKFPGYFEFSVKSYRHFCYIKQVQWERFQSEAFQYLGELLQKNKITSEGHICRKEKIMEVGKKWKRFEDYLSYRNPNDFVMLSEEVLEKCIPNINATIKDEQSGSLYDLISEFCTTIMKSLDGR
jgi:hypothetical protein